jgi:hypothetical protein
MNTYMIADRLVFLLHEQRLSRFNLIQFYSMVAG